MLFLKASEDPAKTLVARRPDEEPFEEGTDVEAGTTAEDREPSPREDLERSGPGETGELPGAERIGRLLDVDEVVRHTPPFLDGGLGGSGVDASVGGEGVGGNDLAAEPERQFDGKG
jgi:hypothetical protein